VKISSFSLVMMIQNKTSHSLKVYVIGGGRDSSDWCASGVVLVTRVLAEVSLAVSESTSSKTSLNSL